MERRRNEWWQDSSRQAIHREIVRISERIVAFQVKIVLDRFDRLDRLVRLGVAALAGMIAIPGFFLARGVALPRVAIVMIGLSVLAVILAVFLLVRINAAFHRGVLLGLGPNPRDVIQEVEAQEMEENEFSDYLVRLMPGQVEANARAIQSVSQRYGTATVIIAVGVFLYLAAIVYILGRLMHA